jgi:hypothetical protein
MKVKKSDVFFHGSHFSHCFHWIANEKNEKNENSGGGQPGLIHQLLKEMYAFLTKACTRQTPELIPVVSHCLAWLPPGSIT